MAVTVATDADFEQYLNDNERVAIKFMAGWCGQCRLFAPKFVKMSEDAANADITFLDINAEENPKARKWAAVSNLPFFAMVKNGEIVTKDFTTKEDAVKGMIDELKS